MAAILIIEDDEHVASLLQFMLEREGHRVTWLADGNAAHEYISTRAPVDLMVLDSMLPYRDGMQVLILAQRSAAWRAVPVIMLTARSLESDIVAALDAGASDYIVKPFQPQELLARVRRHLSRRTH